jgi:hypothetical protein
MDFVETNPVTAVVGAGLTEADGTTGKYFCHNLSDVPYPVILLAIPDIKDLGVDHTARRR